MKKSLCIFLALLSPAMAEGWFDTWLDNTSTMAQELCSDWHHEMPESGMMPSYLSAEFTSHMGERHGGSTMSWQQASLCLPLADPRRSGGRDWMFNASLNANVTRVNTSGSLVVQNDVLYHFSVPVAAIMPRSNGDSMVLALSPTLDSDFAHSSHSFHINVMGTYRVKYSESFAYALGLAYAPYAGAWSVMPLLAFDWNPTPEWSVMLSGYSLRAMRDMGNGLSLGAFVKGAGGSWAVEREQGTRQLRVRSLVVGATAEYDFSQPGQTKRIISCSVGSILTTAVDVCRFNSDRDRDESHHYHPGLYVSAGVDFRF